MPELIPPMLAALGRLPAGGGWAFEFKYDGSPETLICLR
jgi:bifunctional non-homologous end joining protein LigD